MKHHSYTSTLRELTETSEVEIKSSISAKELSEAVTHTLAEIRKEMTVPGFRKGIAPEKIVREKIGAEGLLTEAAERAISHAYGHIIQDEKIQAIGHPKVSVTKMAEGNPLEFTIVTAVLPRITKLEYAKIAARENAKPAETIDVTEEELKKEQEKVKDVTREDLMKAKEYRAKEKRRIALVDTLTESLSVIIPEVLVESELGRMLSQMKHDIERMRLSFDDYLKHLKKTEEDLKKEWRTDAIKRVKLDLALGHIAEKESLSVDKEKVEAELKHVQEHHKNVDADRARSYFENIFLNQAVFEFLEKQK